MLVFLLKYFAKIIWQGCLQSLLIKVDDVFFFKIRFLKPFRYGCFLMLPVFGECFELALQVAAFQIEDAARFNITADADFVAGEVGNFGQSHHGATGDEIELFTNFFRPFVLGDNVGQFDSLRYRVDNRNFFFQCRQ